MRNIVMIFGMCLVLTSCTKKPQCDLTQKYATVAGDRIGDLFACKNKELIGKDIQGEVEKLKMCENPVVETGLIAALICKPIASYVTTLIVKNALPKKWECSGGLAAAGAEALIYKGCSALPY